MPKSVGVLQIACSVEEWEDLLAVTGWFPSWALVRSWRSSRIQVEFLTPWVDQVVMCLTSMWEAPKQVGPLRNSLNGLCLRLSFYLGRLSGFRAHFYSPAHCSSSPRCPSPSSALQVFEYVPFTEFQVEVLSEYEVAPSQIHPNSWGFIRAYEVVCREFGCPTSLNVFLYLFKLTKPFSKDKQQWLSLLAHQGRKVFEMNEESVRDFKNLYFKVVPHPGTHPFWINEEGEYRFPLSWNEDWVNPKVEWKELGESELLFVDALGIMSSKSNAYDRFKAHLLNKSKKSVTTGGSNSETSKAVSPEVVPPTSSAVPDSSSARDTSASPSPSIVSAQERKNPEPKYGHINSKEFDHVGFAQEYLVGGNNKIPMNGENFMKNLDFITRNCIKAAAICQAAQNKVKGSVLVPEGEVEQLRARVKAAETENRLIEGEKFELSSKVSKLEAHLALESQALSIAREALRKLEKEKSEGDEKYRRLYAEFKLKIENQKKLEAELQAAQELCDKFSNDAVLLAEEVVENLKEQIQVLMPDFDVSLIGPDNKVVNGVIVRLEPAADDNPIPEEAAAGGDEQVPNAEGFPEAHPTMSDPPPTPPCHGI
ncbi:hypothetical protein PIB30_074260 [Stylosanthes scabra]|uniref:Transposase (putative) gypsy type domain-containing protein n=1 Tax=Stylosanthes scabra TaxID=79078 RepID=A0ABU6SRT0_9FABA|nr:hypothetical protein [Stylosanthes scabra]